MSYPTHPPGMKGVKQNYPWGPDPKDLYRAFIANSDFYGMPVGFLRAVAKDYSIHFTAQAGPLSTQHASPWTNSLYLKDSTFDTLVRMELELPFGESPAIQTAYHESAHAFLDLKEDQTNFKKFIADGVKHYTGAPMAGGGVSRDPDRLFQEAAASYVGHRAASWWSAYETLVILLGKQKAETDDQVKHRVKVMAMKTPREYNDAMTERVFGYEEKSWHSSDQIETQRPISNDMKKFLDHELLEDKIPDDFNSVSAFGDLLAEIVAL